MATFREMSEDIAAEFNRRGITLTSQGGRTIPAVHGQPITAKEIFEYSPHGELWMVFEWYYSLFPERLPTSVDNPDPGALRYNAQSHAVECWLGGQWRS